MASFISTTDLADFLHRTLLPEEAGAAAMAVDAASEVCRSFCGISFDAATNQTVVLDGHGTRWLLLPEVPVTDVDSVTLYDGLSGETLLTEGADEDYTWTADGRLYRVNTIWPRTPQAITVQYDYGYSTVPSPVRMVAVQVAGRIFAQGLARQESIGGYSLTYGADQAFMLTAAEERVLSRYRHRLLGAY
jgi:hypothetical protein